VIRPQKKAAPVSFRARLSLARAWFGVFRRRLAIAAAVLLGRVDHLIEMNREQRRAVERAQRKAAP